MNPNIELLIVKASLADHTKRIYFKEREVMDLLHQEFPMMTETRELDPESNTIYKTLYSFADLTKQLISKGNLKEVKHCFWVAEKILLYGNNHIKNAVENVYVYSVSSMLDVTNPISRVVKNLLTDALKKEYNRQICARAI